MMDVDAFRLLKIEERFHPESTDESHTFSSIIGTSETLGLLGLALYPRTTILSFTRHASDTKRESSQDRECVFILDLKTSGQMGQSHKHL